MTAGFTPLHPVVVDMCDGFWKMHEPLQYTTEDSRIFTIPSGQLTDYGSIPEILDWIPGLAGNGTDADCSYLLHDYLYSEHRAGRGKVKDRAEADVLLLEALKVCGVGYVRRYTIYWGVRVGGGIAWNKK